MLAKRIIPCLDIKDNRVVKGIKFLGLKDAGDPVEAARAYDRQGADELVFLDITASVQRRKILIKLVEKIAKNIFIPFSVGGGVADIGDIRNLLNAGAEKISINTQAVKYPNLISDASRRFGSQCIIVAIDAKRTNEPLSRTFGFAGGKRTAKWEVYINGGRTPTGLDAIEWAKKAVGLGAGEILLTSMDSDGTKDGYDIELTKELSKAVDTPVIASGGAGKPQDFREVFSKTDASAALAASIFHYRQYTIKEVKQYLKKKGIPVRL
jgi:imidazole glycerol-phosphate synthase subunit HisF